MQRRARWRDANITIVLIGDEERTGAPLAIYRRDLSRPGAADVCAGNRKTGHGRRPRRRFHRAAQLDQQDADRARPHRRQLDRLRRDSGPRRDLRRPASSTPSAASCRVQPHLQFGVMAGGAPGGLDPDGFRAAAFGKTNIVARERLSPRRPAHADAEQDERVARPCQRSSGGICANTERRARRRRGRLPRWRRPWATGALFGRGDRRQSPTPACPKCWNTTRPLRGAADIVLRRGRRWKRWRGGAAGRRTHARGRGGPPSDSLARQAKRAAILITRLTRELGH